ncbi:hypothetical protein OC844_005414 [Tilletia horrida]|nr:hypothetical protein OC844_005414 [Tilletia horrida]
MGDNGTVGTVFGLGVQTLLTIRYFAVALATVVFWEHLLHASHDIRILHRLLSKRKIRFSDLIFLIVRYALLWYIIAGLIFFLGRPDNCVAIKVGIYLSALMGATALNLLFLTRVWLLWNRDKWIVVGPVIILLADVVVWITLTVKWKVVSVKAFIPAPGPSCLFSPDQVDWRGRNWWPRILFEGLACILTLWRLYTLPKLPGHSARQGVGDMRSWFRNSNLIYFGSTFVIYVAGLVGAIHDHHEADGVIWLAIAQVLPLLIGIRLILATPSRRQEERERQLPKHLTSGAKIEDGLPPRAAGTGSAAFFSSFVQRRTERRGSAVTASQTGVHSRAGPGRGSVGTAVVHSMDTVYASDPSRSPPQPTVGKDSDIVQLPAPTFRRSGSISDSIHGLGIASDIEKGAENYQQSPHTPNSTASRPTTIHSHSHSHSHSHAFPAPDGWWRESFYERTARAEAAVSSPGVEEISGPGALGGAGSEGPQRRERRSSSVTTAADLETFAHRPL